MDTLINSSIQLNQTSARKNTSSLTNFLQKSEESRYAISSLVLVFVACFGAMTAATEIDNTYAVALVAFPTTTTLAMILSVAPMRAIYITALISFAANIIALIAL